MLEMSRRADVFSATRSAFDERPFSWGTVDCIKVTAFHLRGMGHAVRFGTSGSYRTALGASRALARAGHATLCDAIASVGLIEIPPAACLLGDILVGPGTDAFEAIGIYVGNEAIYAFHEGTDVMSIGRILDHGRLRGWRA